MRLPPPEDSPTSAQPEWLASWTELFIGNLEEYAVFAIDLSGIILTWQPGVRQVLGYERDAFVGRHTDFIFTASDRHAGAPGWEMSDAVKTGQATDERWHIRADGSRFWGSGIMIALPDRRGETVGLAKIVRDRTALRLEGELQDLRTMRLEGDIASRTRQVQALAADLTLAEQRERQRISQLLHDELQQQLYALQMMLHGAQAQARESGKKELYETLAEAYDLAKAGLVTTRTLVSELSPAALRQGKFDEALVWLSGHMHARYDLTVTLTGIEACPALPEALGLLLFQCVQELLFNVVKHARIDTVSVTLQTSAASFRLEVEDEGQGFTLSLPEPDTFLPAALPSPLPAGFGLYNVEQRLKVFGGVLRIVSSPVNGTRVTIELPLA